MAVEDKCRNPFCTEPLVPAGRLAKPRTKPVFCVFGLIGRVRASDCN